MDPKAATKTTPAPAGAKTPTPKAPAPAAGGAPAKGSPAPKAPPAGKAAPAGKAPAPGGALTGDDEAGNESLLTGGDEGSGAEGAGEGAGAGEGEGEGETAAEIELKLPEGFQPDEALVGKFKTTAKELGLDSAKAQKVFDLYAEAQDALIQQIVAGHQAERQEEQQAWVKEIRADKEFGGEKFDASVRAARKVIEKFGPELRPWLNESGLTNHPGLFRLLARIGFADTEDSSAGAGGGGKGPAAPADPYKALAQKLYRNTKQG